MVPRRGDAVCTLRRCELRHLAAWTERVITRRQIDVSVDGVGVRHPRLQQLSSCLVAGSRQYPRVGEIELMAFLQRACQCRLTTQTGTSPAMWKFAVSVAGVGIGLYALNRCYFSGSRCMLPGRLDGKLAIVTGANSGIGRETTAELARRGARVIMACRNQKRAEEAKADILARYGESSRHALTLNVASRSLKQFLTPVRPEQLIIEELDLASFNSVRAFVARICKPDTRIDLLINNAGIMACPYSLTKDGFESQVGTNHLGHFLLTELLMPALKRAVPGARIINLSSLAHERVQKGRARSRNDDSFHQLRNMTAKSARDAWKQSWTEIATFMQQASNVGDVRKLYRLIRQVGAEFFPPAYAVPCDPPPGGEVADAIRKLRKNKAPGEDGIPAEIHKSCVDTRAPWLHEVIKQAWRNEVAPDDWGLGIPVPILKKGDKTRCKDYRGISLIDVAAKVFVIVLLGRFQAVRDSRTSSNQAGFPSARGCVDQILKLRRVLEFYHSFQQPTVACFVDFAAAFDFVHRESLWRIMALGGVPPKIIAIIKAYHRLTTARVLARRNISHPSAIRSGVRHGSILSPILFN
nr:unnamed protein product [Spirometra erinaceieuropaei]